MKKIKTHFPASNQASEIQAVWNNSALYKTTNCYAFSLGLPEAGKAMPGELVDVYEDDFPDDLIDAEELEARMIEVDGLVKITKSEALSGKFHAIALKIQTTGEDRDFHYLRYNPNDQSWHHKLDALPTNLDDDLKIIRDPENCVDRKYDTLVGYYKIPETGIQYIKVLDF